MSKSNFADHLHALHEALHGDHALRTRTARRRRDQRRAIDQQRSTAIQELRRVHSAKRSTRGCHRHP